jgi:hypothetical protein
MKYSPIPPALLDEKAGDAAAPEGDNSLAKRIPALNSTIAEHNSIKGSAKTGSQLQVSAIAAQDCP